MIDLANYRSLKEQFETLKNEVLKFSPNLAKRDYAIALTRLDAAMDSDERIIEFLSEFKFDRNVAFADSKEEDTLAYDMEQI